MKARLSGAPHPALRATFSRKREKECSVTPVLARIMLVSLSLSLSLSRGGARRV